MGSEFVVNNTARTIWFIGANRHSSQELDLVTATAYRDCFANEGIAINVNNTLVVPDHVTQGEVETCEIHSIHDPRSVSLPSYEPCSRCLKHISSLKFSSPRCSQRCVASGVYIPFNLKMDLRSLVNYGAGLKFVDC
jgi:hypothetical protein